MIMSGMNIVATFSTRGECERDAKEFRDLLLKNGIPCKLEKDEPLPFPDESDYDWWYVKFDSLDLKRVLKGEE